MSTTTTGGPRHLATPVSPKVSFGALAGVLAAVVAAILSALLVDPTALGVDMPQWLLFLLVASAPVIIQALTAYAKSDPLRDAGAAVIQARQQHGLSNPGGTP